MAIQHSNNSSGLGDLLERILDKGIVIAGDIKISLADVELLNIKIRLLVASVDKAKEMGIDWWAHDPYLSSRARIPEQAITGNTEPEPIKSPDVVIEHSSMSKEHSPMYKEHSPMYKEDSPMPKEDSPMPKEDSPMPKEDSSMPNEEKVLIKRPKYRN